MPAFIPDKIFYEPDILHYDLGQTLMNRYKAMQIPLQEITNHNNIEALRTQPNSQFPNLKKHLIIGTRKTHKYTDNHKVSDYLVPWTSSGCTAMCTYCYLVCSYNKCAYLRLFVNREQMMANLIKKARLLPPETTFEIGSNSDLVLENTITGNLPWTIENFLSQPHGRLTFPTKFNMVSELLPLDHQKRIIIRVSLNPDHIINHIEFGTSRLNARIQAINSLCDAGYPVGILIAPIILIDEWQDHYQNLFQLLRSALTSKALSLVFFEAIFMTYSYIHNKINTEAFPDALPIYNPDHMTSRGRTKYRYTSAIQNEATAYIQSLFDTYFPTNDLLYIV